jgi:hypothetical protein
VALDAAVNDYLRWFRLIRPGRYGGTSGWGRQDLRLWHCGICAGYLGSKPGLEPVWLKREHARRLCQEAVTMTHAAPGVAGARQMPSGSGRTGTASGRGSKEPPRPWAEPEED